ncbi:hypothetical protein ACG2LH_12360 [Zhouia sp. PK063]|uniref:hypothetical protein n=1 Tax=Zhouia sp. PK063 TaxID=3373602 RepID=UPI0037AAA737
MSFKIVLLFIICFICSKTTYATHCKEHSLQFQQQYCFANNNFIALCKIGDNKQLLVVELFRNSDNLDIDHITSNYSSRFNRGEVWLIYGALHKNGELLIDECSVSRNIDKPYDLPFVNDYDIPSPILFQENRTKFNEILEGIKRQSFIDLNDEISQLRKISTINKQNKKSVLYYLIYGVILLQIIVLFLNIKILKKNNVKRY